MATREELQKELELQRAKEKTRAQEEKYTQLYKQFMDAREKGEKRNFEQYRRHIEYKLKQEKKLAKEEKRRQTDANNKQAVANQITQENFSISSKISTLATSRNKEITKLVGQESQAVTLKRASLTAERKTLGIVQSHADAGGLITERMQEQVEGIDSVSSGMNDVVGLGGVIADSKQKELEIQKDLDDFTETINSRKKAGLPVNEEIVQAKKDELKAELKGQQALSKTAESHKEILQLKAEQAQKDKLLNTLTFGLSSKFKDIKKELSEATTKQKMMIGGSALLGAGIALVSKVASAFAETIDKIGGTFGSLNNLGDDLTTSIVNASTEVTNLGFGVSEVNSVVSSLSSEFGVSLDEAANLSAAVLDTAKATGLSVDEATKLTGELRIIAGLSQEQSEALIEGTAQLAKQAGVAPQQVLKDIAGSSETIATFTKGTGENLFEAAVQARAFGVNIDSIAKSARGMLDFETSINAEVEASVLLGKQLNLQKARELALSKDLTGFQKEIKNQLSGIGDFSELNVFQQEALAKSVGMSVSEVAKLVSGTEKLSVAGALSAGSFDDLAGQDALSQLSQLTGQFKELSTTFLNTLGPALMDIIGSVNEFLGKEENITMLKDTVISLANGIATVAKNFDLVVGSIIGIKAGFAILDLLKSKALASTMAGLAQAATQAGLLSGPAAPIVIPAILAALAGAVIASIAAFSIPSFHNLSTGKMAEATKPDSLVNIKKGEAVANVVDINSPEPIQPTISPKFGTQETLNQPTLAPNFGRESAMQKSFGLTDADASRIGKAIGGVLSSNLRLKSTVENRTQRLIIEGATNQIGGKDIVMA